MGGSTPRNTTTTVKPFYGTEHTYEKVHDRFDTSRYDPVTGQPLAYGGPRMADTQFDPMEQQAYNRTMALSSGPNQYAGYAGQQAANLYGLENPAATNVTLNTLNSQFLSDQNPAFQSMVSSIGDAAKEQYNMATGETSGMFSNRGTFGGSQHRASQGKNDAALAKSLTDQIGQLRYDDYANRMSMQQQAAQNVATRGDSFNLAGADALRYANADRLANMGGYRRQSVTDPNQQRAFDYAGNRFNYYQNLPLQEAQLLAEMNRGTGGTTTASMPGPSGMQRAGQGIGLFTDVVGLF